MKYISTRGEAPELSFEEAMLTGLASDGGSLRSTERADDERGRDRGIGWTDI